ncbi:hypothetical protein [Lentzea atacamensis]|nr:hypothetical protein [Lentzea atacamensis]
MSPLWRDDADEVLRLLDRAPISMPMLFLRAGDLTFSVVEPLPDPDPA